MIGIDQSYKNTGISISADGKIKNISNLRLDCFDNNSERRQKLKDKLDTSMILITHDLGVVAQTCDKVAIMYAGEIVEYGTAEDVFNGKNKHLKKK